MYFKLWLTAVLAGWLIIGNVNAQSGRKVAAPAKTAEPPARSADTIQIHTREVRLAVTVRDSLGQAVPALQAADFAIYDNGKRYEPVTFGFQHVPVNVAVLLDDSRRLFDDPEALQQALGAFQQRLEPADQVAVLHFTDELMLTLDWTQDAQAFRKALRPVWRPNGKAALMDAVSLTAAKLAELPGRRVILLFTTGLNTAGLTDYTQAAALAQRVGATLYVFSATEMLTADLASVLAADTAGAQLSAETALARLKLARAEAELTALAETTGGQIFFPLQARSLSWMLRLLTAELSGQYLLTYAPADEAVGLEALHLLHVVVRGGYQTFAHAWPATKNESEARWPVQQKPALQQRFQLVGTSVSVQRFQLVGTSVSVTRRVPTPH